MAACTVAPMPQLNGSRRTRAPARSETWAVSSDEPSSMTRTSGGVASARTSAITHWMLPDSLSAGTTASLRAIGRSAVGDVEAVLPIHCARRDHTAGFGQTPSSRADSWFRTARGAPSSRLPPAKSAWQHGRMPRLLLALGLVLASACGGPRAPRGAAAKASPTGTVLLVASNDRHGHLARL